MWHQTENRPFAVADSRDIVKAPVGIRRVSPFRGVAVFGAISENNHVFLIESLKQNGFFLFRKQEATLSMRDRHTQNFVLRDFARKDAFSSVFIL